MTFPNPLLLPVANITKLLGVIYATSSVFPYDFDWGYADNDVMEQHVSYFFIYYRGHL